MHLAVDRRLCAVGGTSGSLSVSPMRSLAGSDDAPTLLTGLFAGKLTFNLTWMELHPMLAVLA